MNELERGEGGKRFTRITIGVKPSRSISYPYAPISDIISHLRECMDEECEYRFSPMSKYISTTVVVSCVDSEKTKQESKTITTYHETADEILDRVRSAMAGFEKPKEGYPDTFVPRLPEHAMYTPDPPGDDLGMELMGLPPLEKYTMRGYRLEYEESISGDDTLFKFQAISQEMGRDTLTCKGSVLNILATVNNQVGLVEYFKKQLVEFFGGTEVFLAEKPIEL